MPSLHVKYCGGCRSGYDRVAWFRGVLSAMRAFDESIVLTGTHMLHAPYMDGERMGPSDMAVYLLNMASPRNGRDE